MSITLTPGQPIPGHSRYHVIVVHPRRANVALASDTQPDSATNGQKVTRVVKVCEAVAVPRLKRFAGFRHKAFAAILALEEDGPQALCVIEKVGEDDDWPRSLADLVGGRKRLPFFAAWIVVRQMAALVAAVEARGGHGDLQPQNILAVNPAGLSDLKDLRVAAIDPLVPGPFNHSDPTARTGDLTLLEDCPKTDRQDLGRLFLFLLNGKADWYKYSVTSLISDEYRRRWFNGVRGVSPADRDALRAFVEASLNGAEISRLVELLDDMRPARPAPPVYGPGLLVALVVFALPLLLLSCNGTIQVVQHGPELIQTLSSYLIRSTPTLTASPTEKAVDTPTVEPPTTVPTLPSAPPTTRAPQPTTPSPQQTTPAPQPTTPSPTASFTPSPTPSPTPVTPSPSPTPVTPSPEQTMTADEVAKGIIFLEARRGENPSIRAECGAGAELGKLAGEIAQSYRAKLYIHPLKRNGSCVRVWAPHNIDLNGVEGWIELDQVCVPRSFYDRHTAALDELWSVMTGLLLQPCAQEKHD